MPAAAELSASSPSRSGKASSRLAVATAASLILLAGAAAYSSSLGCAFVFDDTADIVGNGSIRHLWPIQDVFIVHTAGGTVLQSRPVVNLSLAVDYAIAGLDPRAYHLTNLVIHLLAGLTLFGIVRRTFLLPGLAQRFASAATPLALTVALIWTLHPLQTGAVTYVTQRYESLMGLFYLLAMYAAIRCGTSPHPRRWAVVTAAAALLAMGCKEVAVSVPVCVLLYDRAFLAGSFREAWRQRRTMYLGLVGAWLAFAVLLCCSGNRGAWAGYGLPVSWIEYGRSQFGVVLHYLRLCFWPDPLVLDYHWPVACSAGQIMPGASVIGALAVATVWALVRRPKWGFVGAWFFLILAPTSSVLPIRDLAFEHRMYLPLAAVVTAAIVAAFLAARWLVGREMVSRPVLRILGGALVIFAGVVFGNLTFQRNLDYRSDLSIWTDTAAKAPGNAEAQNSLGAALMGRGRFDEAIPCFQKALEIEPNDEIAHNNLALALAKCGQVDQSIAHFRQALEINPHNAQVRRNFAVVLRQAKSP